MKHARKNDTYSMLEHSPCSEPLSIVPIPFDWGTDFAKGVGSGPRYLLEGGFASSLEQAGFKLNVMPELPVSERDRKKFHRNGGDMSKDLAMVLKDIRDVVQGQMAKGHRVITLGGDHTISIGTIAGASAAMKGDMGVIWIDIHPDAHTHATSLSKNPHGMPTTAVMGVGDKKLTAIVTKPVRPKNFLYIGTRDADKGELQNMRALKLRNVSMHDIALRGMQVALDAVDELAKKTKNIWVSMDLDSVDISAAPGTAMGTVGSFGHREIVALMTAIGKRCKVVGMDIVELVPAKDVDRKTALLALELAAAAFGAKQSWYTRHMSKYGDWYGDSRV